MTAVVAEVLIVRIEIGGFGLPDGEILLVLRLRRSRCSAHQGFRTPEVYRLATPLPAAGSSEWARPRR